MLSILARGKEKKTETESKTEKKRHRERERGTEKEKLIVTETDGDTGDEIKGETGSERVRKRQETDGDSGRSDRASESLSYFCQITHNNYLNEIKPVQSINRSRINITSKHPGQGPANSCLMH